MNYQTKKQATWTDEAGNSIPYKSLKKKEIILENCTYRIATEALKAEKQLMNFHEKLKCFVTQCIVAVQAGYTGKKTEFKGNYTLYNFDRSIKVCVKVSNPIKFDDIIIEQARQLLKEFLDEGITAKTDFIKVMVLEAFETRSGQMDTKRVMGLQRYADRIEDKRYHDAMSLINEAIRRPETATYYQVWLRKENGQYKSVVLDLAAL